ncbi:18812_t:CDS:10 [Entrophospora sp. SA101]|nr:10211_t:CDS:10 [Entrophospora sp. SA101]CAJ0765848.1 18812_t:CDS:10 [Entrophospora sp. SA101]
MTCKAIIIVGGPSRGTRFRPLSLDVPKPLFPVAGYPIIWHHLEALTKVEGLKEVLLIGFYEDNVFQKFIDDASIDFPGINIRYLREYQSLGTAGGIYHFRDGIQRDKPEHVFVLNADVACDFPLAEMMKFHNTHRGLCTILGKKINRENAHKYGCLVAKPDSHEVLHYVEKPESFISDLISCGIYLFDCAIFLEMKKAMANKSNQLDQNVFQEHNEKLRLEQDIIRPLAESKKLYVYETKEFWRQIKTPSSAVPVNASFLKKYLKTNPNLLLKNQEGGPEIHGCIGPDVSIGPRVVIGKGVRIKNSIILDNVEIKDNSCILNSIIGWGSKIGTWARVEGTQQANDQISIIQDGIVVQSITILAKEVIVQDEVWHINDTLDLKKKEIIKLLEQENSQESLESSSSTSINSSSSTSSTSFTTMNKASSSSSSSTLPDLPKVKNLPRRNRSVSFNKTVTFIPHVPPPPAKIRKKISREASLKQKDVIVEIEDLGKVRVDGKNGRIIKITPFVWPGPLIMSSSHFDQNIPEGHIRDGNTVFSKKERAEEERNGKNETSS